MYLNFDSFLCWNIIIVIVVVIIIIIIYLLKNDNAVYSIVRTEWWAGQQDS